MFFVFSLHFFPSLELLHPSFFFFFSISFFFFFSYFFFFFYYFPFSFFGMMHVRQGNHGLSSLPRLRSCSQSTRNHHVKEKHQTFKFIRFQVRKNKRKKRISGMRIAKICIRFDVTTFLSLQNHERLAVKKPEMFKGDASFGFYLAVVITLRYFAASVGTLLIDIFLIIFIQSCLPVTTKMKGSKLKTKASVFLSRPELLTMQKVGNGNFDRETEKPSCSCNRQTKVKENDRNSGNHNGFRLFCPCT